MKRKLNFLSIFALMAMAFAFILVSCDKDEMTLLKSYDTSNYDFAAFTNDNDDELVPFLVVDLLAGQNDVVGTVAVTNDADKLCVTYALDVDAIAAGWGIYETHLYLGDEQFDGVLTKKNPRLGDPYEANPIPGKFPYGDDELGGVEKWTFCISFDDLGFETCDIVYIAAHAVVKRYAGQGDMTSAVLYGNIGGYENGQGEIWEIDPIDRSETKIFECPAGVDFEANWYPNALAHDEENHRLYFTTGRNTLMFYDFSSESDITALTDASSDVFTNNNNVLGAAFGDGAFWYVLNQSGKLYRVDFDDEGIATGRIEYVMTEKSLTQGDIVYADGMIFGSSGTGAGGEKGFFSYEIGDNTSFNFFYEGSADFAAPQLAWGLDADGKKVLYATLGGDQRTLWIVDTETGEMTQVMADSDRNDPFVTENLYQDLASFIDYEKTWESQTAWGEGCRFNERGNWGMFFEYKIEPHIVIFPEGGRTTVAFEDGTDYDYNDFVVAIDTEATFYSAGLKSLEYTFTPLARGASYNHRFGMRFPAGTFDIGGEYTLTIYKGDGSSEVDQETGTFSAGAVMDFTILAQTSDAIPNMRNHGWPLNDPPPYYPTDRIVTLSIEFDEIKPFYLGTIKQEEFTKFHGQELFFEPHLFVYNTNLQIDPGNVRILTVPDDWKWPKGAVRIWNAYPYVTSDLEFTKEWWLNYIEDFVYDDHLK